MFCLRIKKGVQPSDAYSPYWLPASDLDINKQEQFTPLTDMNLLNCLLSCLNILPVF